MEGLHIDQLDDRPLESTGRGYYPNVTLLAPYKDDNLPIETGCRSTRN